MNTKHNQYTYRYKDKMYAQGKCVACCKLNPLHPKVLCQKCSARNNKCNDERRLNNKKIVFQHYGNGKCTCCDESIFQFLSIDHINNDGAKKRKEKGGWAESGKGLYSKLIKKGFPDGYTVLCHNCNLGRHINGGTCPHREMNNGDY